MNIRIQALALAFLLPLTACGDKTVSAESIADAAKSGIDSLGEGLKGIDLSAMKPEAMMEKAGSMMSSLAGSLGSVKDLASAEALKEKAGPVIDMLGKMKSALGDKMPTMDSVKTAVDALKSKFSGDSAIMDALKPMIEKITGLMG